MKISWYGGSTIELKGTKQRAILNPLNDKQIQGAQLVVYSETDEKHESPEEGLMVDWPGEYDTSGYVFKGIEFHGKKDSYLSYVFQTSEGSIAWLAELAEYPNEAFIEALGEVHVLLIPVGGNDVLAAKDAFKLVEELEPLAIIPICYGDKREGLAPLLKEMDVKPPEEQSSYELKRSVFSQEQMELVLLKKG